MPHEATSASAAGHDGLPHPQRWRAIVALSLGIALVVIDGAIPTAALPTIARDLGVANSTAVLIVTVYQLTLVMALLPFSALGDRIGLERLYQRGQIIFIIASLLCFFANSLPFLLIIRTAQALGAAAMLSVSSALLRQIYPSHMLGRGLGINSVVVLSASAFAPSIGGFILDVGRWPWVFVACVPFGVVSYLMSRNALPKIAPHEEPYDLVGAMMWCALSGLIVIGLEAIVHGDSPIVALAIVGLGFLIGHRFVKRTLQQERPVLPMDLLSDPIIALSIAGAMLAFLASMTLMLSLPFRLQTVYDFTPGQIGALLAPWPLAMLVVAPLAAAMSDRIPPHILGTLGMSIAAVAALLIAFLPEAPTSFDIIWRMILGGAGFGMFSVPNARVVIAASPMSRAAAAGGLISTNRLFGQTLGATLAAALLALGVGTGSMPGIAAAILAAAAAICSVSRRSVAR